MAEGVKSEYEQLQELAEILKKQNNLYWLSQLKSVFKIYDELAEEQQPIAQKLGILSAIRDAVKTEDAKLFAHYKTELIRVQIEGSQKFEEKINEQIKKFSYLKKLLLNYELAQKFSAEIAILHDFIKSDEVAQFDKHYDEIMRKVRKTIGELEPIINRQWGVLMAKIPDELKSLMTETERRGEKNRVTLKMFEEYIPELQKILEEIDKRGLKDDKVKKAFERASQAIAELDRLPKVITVEDIIKTLKGVLEERLK